MARSRQKTSDDENYISRVALLGVTSGLVKGLAGFRKKHHSVPDAISPATSAFLARLCSEELAEDAEAMFQRAKETLGYKRRELTLDVTPPTAVLASADFTWELTYELAEDDPSSWLATRSLHSLGALRLVEQPEFDELFAGQFETIQFALVKGVSVEAVIDAVEDLPAASPMRVEYPSDCRECSVRVAGVEAVVRCDGGSLEMIFPRTGSPGELVKAFRAVRSAFSLAQDPILAGLL